MVWMTVPSFQDNVATICSFKRTKAHIHVRVRLSHQSTIKPPVAAPLFFFFSKIEIHLFFQNDAIQPLWGLRLFFQNHQALALWGLRLSFEITTTILTCVSFCTVKLGHVRRIAVVARSRDLWAQIIDGQPRSSYVWSSPGSTIKPVCGCSTPSSTPIFFIFPK